jgi:general secretion pathway protein A
MAYVTLVGFNGDQAMVLHEQEIKSVELGGLGQLWNGDFSFVWHRPKTFDGKPVGLGSNGPSVEWVAKQFAKLDGQEAPLAEQRFNSALEARVKRFQSTMNLEDDGFVGMQTLLRLNEALGLDLSLDDLSFSTADQALSATAEEE